MNKHFKTVFALAKTSPGFDVAANHADIIQAKRELAAHAGLQAAAQALIGAWGRGNLSQPMQAIQKAVDAFSALSSLPAPGHVRKFLDLSTAHLDAEGRDHLEQGGEGMVVYPTAYGWFVYVSEADALASYTVPQCLLDILDRARQLGCDYVLLDCDAEEDSELPTFDEAGAVEVPETPPQQPEPVAEVVADASNFCAEPGTPPWDEAWAALVAEFGDPVCLSTDGCHSWQYLGTTQKPDGTWKHIFRHRSLSAAGGQRTYREYPATPLAR